MENNFLACAVRSTFFRPVSCPNEGCIAMHSARDEATHDAECAFKLLVSARLRPRDSLSNLYIRTKIVNAHSAVRMRPGLALTPAVVLAISPSFYRVDHVDG